MDTDWHPYAEINKYMRQIQNDVFGPHACTSWGDVRDSLDRGTLRGMDVQPELLLHAQLLLGHI